MYQKTSNFAFKMPVLLLLLFLFGCTTSPTKVGDTDNKIEIVSSKHLKISDVVFVKNSTGFLLQGDIRDIHSFHPKPKGHVDIDIVDDKKRVLKKTRTSIHKSEKVKNPSNNSKLTHRARTSIHKFGNAKRLGNRYNFSIEVPYVAPEGSVIRLSYHEGTKH